MPPANALESIGMDAPADRRCEGCGYLLHGLTEPRCPECGLQFDPNSPPTPKIPWLQMSDESRPRAFLRTVAMVLWDPVGVAAELRSATGLHIWRINQFRWICILVAVLSLDVVVILLSPGILVGLIAVLLLYPGLVTWFAMTTMPLRIMHDQRTLPERNQDHECIAAASLVLYAILPLEMILLLVTEGRPRVVTSEWGIVTLLCSLMAIGLSVFLASVRTLWHLAGRGWRRPVWLTITCLCAWWVAALAASFMLLAAGIVALVVVAVFT